MASLARVLCVTRASYLEEFARRAAAARTAMASLVRAGWQVECLCGIAGGGETIRDPQPASIEAVQGPAFVSIDPALHVGPPDSRRISLPGVSITVHLVAGVHPASGETARRDELLAALDSLLTRQMPEMLVVSGTEGEVRAIFDACRGRETTRVLLLDDFDVRDPSLIAAADGLLVTAPFLAEYYRDAFGAKCAVIPGDGLAQPLEWPRTGYVTFVDPTPAHGVFAFARIADELARSRPDIPVLVVEGEATEATLAACGLELSRHGTVNLMSPARDSRDVWEQTRIAVVPHLATQGRPPSAAGALRAGRPVVASDRGGLPEVVGDAGILLPLPDRMTPATAILPTPEEVAPWVEAIARLWDDEALAGDYRRRALARSARRDPDAESALGRFLRDLGPSRGAPATRPRARERWVALVPHLNGIEWECEESLRRLEEAGVAVVRRRGSSAVDVARNEMISDALHDGFESILFIDADLGFDPQDALRLLARPEPVLCGVYAKKATRELAIRFAAGVDEIIFGPRPPGLYPARYVATGFLRIRAPVLRRMADELGLPLCNTRWNRGNWPFFLPLYVPDGDDRFHYLGEDWAFSHRLGQIGITPLADTSIRLWHIGRYSYGWEDAGTDVRRYRTYRYRIADDLPG